MFLRLLALFTVVPLLELVLLVQIGRYVGLVPTVALVLFTGALGAYLARRQGAITWTRVQAALRRGELPGEALLDALLILIAGAVLLTPGLLTDIFGFTLLVPAGRALVRSRIARRLERSLAQRQAGSRVIVVEAKRLDDDS